MTSEAGSFTAGGPARGRVRIGSVPIDRVTFAAALDAVEALVAAGNGGTVFTPNVDHVVLAEEHPEFRAAYERTSLSLVDGVPVLLASRMLRDPLPQKVSGSDLVGPLLERAASRGWGVYLLGGAPGSAEKAAAALRDSIGAHVVGVSAPTVETSSSAAAHATIADAIVRARPDLVLVGLGAPKQELFSDAIASRVRPAVLVCVGASIDFLAGAVPRAPAWISRSGLEWLYRLSREPRRLWRRYLLRDPKFLWIVLRQMRAAEERRGP